MFPQFDALVNYKIISFVVPEINDETILDVISLMKTCKGSRKLMYSQNLNFASIVADIAKYTNWEYCDVELYMNSKLDYTVKFQTIVMFYYYLRTLYLSREYFTKFQESNYCQSYANIRRKLRKYSKMIENEEYGKYRRNINLNISDKEWTLRQYDTFKKQDLAYRQKTGLDDIQTQRDIYDQRLTNLQCWNSNLRRYLLLVACEQELERAQDEVEDLKKEVSRKRQCLGLQ